MDRLEFKERIERIDSLLLEEKYEDALDLLDSINWRKVLNVNYLLDGAQRYDKLGKKEDAKELLEIAHDRSPFGRMIIYRLAESCANMGQIEEAKSYYQKFIELAPNDNIRFVLKYIIHKQQGADNATLISILEELRANELLEEWAFELACLYRKNGQVDKCISLLDDIILWFGDGPYVEQALEIKRLYRPLSKEQEIAYQRMTTTGGGVVEIRPGDRAARNEFLGKTIRIPEIEEEINEKYNTQNLQAEIRKNIEEIMKASEMGEVTENIDAIKELIEDIPHLQMKEDAESEDEKKFNTKQLDETLKTTFNAYLAEENDGQLSIADTGKETEDDYIEGQLTIDEVMDRWEKTRRAAEQALKEAKEKELIRYKEQAIAKASDVLDRLIAETKGEDINLKEDIKEEVKEDITEEPEKESEEEPKEELKEEFVAANPEEDEPAGEPGRRTFKIPQIVAVGEVEGKAFEIPILTAEEAGLVSKESEPEQVEGEEPAQEPEPELSIDPLPAEEEDEEPKVSPVEAFKDINDMLQKEIDKLQNDDIVEEKKPELGNTTTNLPLIDITDLGEMDDIPDRLSAREKELLSYFANIPGMEQSLLNTVSRIKIYLKSGSDNKEGNLVIIGREGSGKTRLGQNIIKILQEETGKLSGNVGRISAEKLNEKDVHSLFDKIRGGALIIEGAGQLNSQTLLALNLSIESDKEKTFIVLEDARPAIEKLLKMDPRFSQKFTETISIPVMTRDELVSFGKIYAAENGYNIDEMGVLALYDRVNVSGTREDPASVLDVKLIVDSAIEASQNNKFKGIFSVFGKKSDKVDGVLTLQERDFWED